LGADGAARFDAAVALFPVDLAAATGFFAEAGALRDDVLAVTDRCVAVVALFLEDAAFLGAALAAALRLRAGAA